MDIENKAPIMEEEENNKNELSEIEVNVLPLDNSAALDNDIIDNVSIVESIKNPNFLHKLKSRKILSQLTHKARTDDSFEEIDPDKTVGTVTKFWVDNSTNYLKAKIELIKNSHHYKLLNEILNNSISTLGVSIVGTVYRKNGSGHTPLNEIVGLDFTTIPAYPGAVITAMKSLKKNTKKDFFRTAPVQSPITSINKKILITKNFNNHLNDYRKTFTQLFSERVKQIELYLTSANDQQVVKTIDIIVGYLGEYFNRFLRDNLFGELRNETFDLKNRGGVGAFFNANGVKNGDKLLTQIAQTVNKLKPKALQTNKLQVSVPIFNSLRDGFSDLTYKVIYILLEKTGKEGILETTELASGFEPLVIKSIVGKYTQEAFDVNQDSKLNNTFKDYSDNSFLNDTIQVKNMVDEFGENMEDKEKEIIEDIEHNIKENSMKNTNKNYNNKVNRNLSRKNPRMAKSHDDVMEEDMLLDPAYDDEQLTDEELLAEIEGEGMVVANRNRSSTLDIHMRNERKRKAEKIRRRNESIQRNTAPRRSLKRSPLSNRANARPTGLTNRNRPVNSYTESTNARIRRERGYNPVQVNYNRPSNRVRNNSIATRPSYNSNSTELALASPEFNSIIRNLENKIAKLEKEQKTTNFQFRQLKRNNTKNTTIKKDIPASINHNTNESIPTNMVTKSHMKKNKTDLVINKNAVNTNGTKKRF